MNVIPIQEELPGHRAAQSLRIAGITRFTTIDFPGCLAAVVFLKGCPWKCPYCQNPELQTKVFSEEDPGLSWEYLENFLQKRQGLIDGVVFSGGEPFTDPALYSAIAFAKELGYKIGIHTGGMYPAKLQEVLPMLDWVGLDVKAPLEDDGVYSKVVGRTISPSSVKKSLELIVDSPVSLEVRTTVHPDLLSDDQILEIGRFLQEHDVKNYAVQVYRQPPELREEETLPRVGSHYPAPEVLSELEKMFDNFILRRP